MVRLRLLMVVLLWRAGATCCGVPLCAWPWQGAVCRALTPHLRLLL